MTTKTPAAPPPAPGVNWAPPAPQYDPSNGAFDAYGEGYVSPSDPTRAPASLAHAEASSSAVHTNEYVPGGGAEPAWARASAQPAPFSSGTPYYWERDGRAKPVARVAIIARWVVILALVAVTLYAFAYAGLSAYAASQLIYAPQVAPDTTPASLQLKYQDVTFLSRTDHVALSGWFIPGVNADGSLTDARTIIVVHGMRANREDKGAGLLALSGALAQHGMAVLAFDMRGSGLSQAAPLSLGIYEQRDVLGAADYLLKGPLPFSLGKPQAIGGLGVSMGAATLLMAAAQDTAIGAVVSDSAYSDAIPLLEREIPKRSGLPAWFTPGVLIAARAMYNVDFTQARPVDVVARIAPRPILFIQGAADTYVPVSDLGQLADAARQGAGAKVQTWLVPGATHAQAYKVAGAAYVDRVVAFFTTNLAVS